MKVKLVAYGIARDILQSSELGIEINDDSDISSLKATLTDNYPEFHKLSSLKFAINEDYQDDNYRLQEMDEVVIIPPVSGG